MEQIAVVINDIVVHTENVQDAGAGMMQAHFVRKIYCVQKLVDNGIDAKVMIQRAGGRTIELTAARLDTDEVLVVPSKMNTPDYEPEPDWFDDILKKHPFSSIIK